MWECYVVTNKIHKPKYVMYILSYLPALQQTVPWIPVIDGVLEVEDITTTPIDATLSGSTLSGERASLRDTVLEPAGTDICKWKYNRKFKIGT